MIIKLKKIWSLLLSTLLKNKVCPVSKIEELSNWEEITNCEEKKRKLVFCRCSVFPSTIVKQIVLCAGSWRNLCILRLYYELIRGFI